MLLRAPTLLLLASLSGACGMGTQRLKVDNVSYQDLFRLTAHVIDSEGFMLDEIDANEGLITTRWDYDKLVDVGRFPIRRRAEARIDPAGEGVYEVELSIEQEALRQGFGLSNPEKASGWESYGYDKQTTRDILTRIKLFVRDFKPSDEFYDRYKKKQDLKKTVPDVLDSEEDG